MDPRPECPYPGKHLFFVFKQMQPGGGGDFEIVENVVGNAQLPRDVHVVLRRLEVLDPSPL